MSRLEEKLIELGYEKEWSLGFRKTITLSPIQFDI